VASELDPSQSVVASVGPSERQIVIAGPGSGKSHVVGALAAGLVGKGIYPEEVLVLSFSRIAVEIVEERTRHVVDEGHGVIVSTVDSLAARIRREMEEKEPTFTSYEHSIRRATQLLCETDGPLLPEVRHLVVDEAQDLVGARAAFVLAVLEHGLENDCGFTLLGDPLQSLYDFQVDRTNPLDNEALLREVRVRYAPEERELTGEYRSRSPRTALTASRHRSLTAASPSERLIELKNLLTDSPPLGDFDRDTVEDIALWTGRTALLCDTNIRSLLVAEAAREMGLAVEVGTDQADAVYPAWIAVLLDGYSHPYLARSDFLDLAARHGIENGEDKWGLLAACPQVQGQIDLSRLALSLAGGVGGHRWRTESPTRVTATTVHRAKGAEFDNIVLIDPDDWFEDDPSASSRRLFVALTRARSRLTRAHGIRTRSWYRVRGPGGNLFWVKRPRGRRNGTVEIALEATYARALGPVPHDLNGLVGSPVRWTRTGDLTDVSGCDVPSWTGEVDGAQVVRTDEVFGSMIRNLAFDKACVPALSGGLVEGTETVLGRPRQSGPGRHGLWLGARVVGSLHLDWTVCSE